MQVRELWKWVRLKIDRDQTWNSERSSPRKSTLSDVRLSGCITPALQGEAGNVFKCLMAVIKRSSVIPSIVQWSVLCSLTRCSARVAWLMWRYQIVLQSIKAVFKFILKVFKLLIVEGWSHELAVVYCSWRLHQSVSWTNSWQHVIG